MTSPVASARPHSPADDRSHVRAPLGGVRGAVSVLRRAAVEFYDDQMTQHAGALTYYALMSLFPTLLVSLSLLGLVGEYPRTYNAIVEWLRNFTPSPVLEALDASLRSAFQRKSGAATTLVVSILVALYGLTGVLECTRRALNVVFDIEYGRSFLRRKAVDVASTVVLMALVLSTLVLVFVGGSVAENVAGEGVARIWSLARWPAALLAATLVFAWLYFITADRAHRRFRLFTTGSVAGVLLWVGVSVGFSEYVSHVVNVSAIYGAFATAIVVVAWLWLTGVALFFGAELDAEVERRGIAAGTVSRGPRKSRAAPSPPPAAARR